MGEFPLRALDNLHENEPSEASVDYAVPRAAQVQASSSLALLVEHMTSSLPSLAPRLSRHVSRPTAPSLQLQQTHPHQREQFLPRGLARDAEVLDDVAATDGSGLPRQLEDLVSTRRQPDQGRH